MSEQHKMSEYIDNLSLKKKFCMGFRPDDVYEVICDLTSMYNEILAESYEENENIKHELEFLKKNGVSQVTSPEESSKENLVSQEIEEKRGNNSMTDKELQRLKRGELLEMLLEQSKENEALKIQVANLNEGMNELRDKLEDRKIKIEKAGTLAEASLLLNGVFESAQLAAQQYLDNLKETEDKCTAMTYVAQERCEVMKEETKQFCDKLESDTRKKCEEMETSTRLKCETREREAEERCTALDQKAKQDVEKRWDELTKRLEDFYRAHEGLRDLLKVTGQISRE